jgi:hypothetical protein
LELYGTERDRLLKMCATAHAMGIAQRQVAMAEKIGGLMAELVRGLLDDLELTDEQRTLAAAAVPKRLALISTALDKS